MKRAVLIVAGLALALPGCSVFKKTTPKAAVLGERLPVLSYEAKLAADPALTEVAITLPPPVANDEWSQPGGNASKAFGHLALGATVARAWTVSIGTGSTRGAELNAAPVVAGGKIYAMDTRATVAAFDAKSGASLWASRIARDGESMAIAFGGGVSVGDGRVYATSGYGIAAAFDAGTGAQLWRVDLGVPLRGAPSVAGGRVYVLSQDNQLFALKAADGKSDWEATGTSEQAGLLGASAPAVAQDTAVVGFSSGELVALRVENGRSVWQDALARTGRSTALAALADIDASPVIDRGRVFAIGHGGRIAALELSTGQRVWEQNLAGTFTPWVAGEFVYAVTLDGEVVCLTRGEGKVRWIMQLPKTIKDKAKGKPIRWAGPVLASDRLILTSSDGRLVAVSPYDGKLLSQVKLTGPASQPPVIAGGTVYVLADDGKLSAYW